MALEQDEPETETEAALLDAAKRSFPTRRCPSPPTSSWISGVIRFSPPGSSRQSGRCRIWAPSPCPTSIRAVPLGDRRDTRMKLRSTTPRHGGVSSRRRKCERFLRARPRRPRCRSSCALMSAPWLCIFIGCSLISGEDASMVRDMSRSVFRRLYGGEHLHDVLRCSHQMADYRAASSPAVIPCGEVIFPALAGAAFARPRAYQMVPGFATIPRLCALPGREGRHGSADLEIEHQSWLRPGLRRRPRQRQRARFTIADARVIEQDS